MDAQQGRQYDITRDGCFLINMVLDSAAAPITLLMNWNPGRGKGSHAQASEFSPILDKTLDNRQKSAADEAQISLLFSTS